MVDIDQIDSSSAASGQQCFSTGVQFSNFKAKNLILRVEKYRTPLVVERESVSSMTKTSKIYLSC